MIHMRPKRRLGAALFVGIAGAGFLAFRQPWQLRPLSPGEHPRLKAIKLFAARPPQAGFGLEGADLRDAVNAGSKSPIVGPAPIIDAVPKVTPAIIGPAALSVDGPKEAAREGAAAPAGDDSRAGRKGRATRMDSAERARVSGKTTKAVSRKNLGTFRKKGGPGRGGASASKGRAGRKRVGPRRGVVTADDELPKEAPPKDPFFIQ
jgi:hypothetical protein